ncbi:MAG: hypothetical protein ABSG65_22490 [Bryobacteraceae bacterium]
MGSDIHHSIAKPELDRVQAVVVTVKLMHDDPRCDGTFNIA